MLVRLLPYVLFVALGIQQFSQQKFDLRAKDGQNYVTSVKSQQGGTCWTHGALAAIESNLLISGKWAELGIAGEADLAEYHLDWWCGFNQHNNDDLSPVTGDGLTVHNGGDYMVTSAYISRGEGPIKELEMDPYSSAPERRSAIYKYFYVRDIEWYDVQENFNNIYAIKQALKTHGAIGTCMCYSADFIVDFIHYQPNTSLLEPNHAIAIVGWDDTIVTPGKYPGAWICKNSWGPTWGLDGYFWISYYDKYSIRHPEMGAVSFQNTEELHYANVYYHDYHGWRDTFQGVSKAFNKFIGVSNEVLSSVSFYTTADNSNCNVEIYDEFINGDLSGLLTSQQTFISKKGFHTIDLNNVQELSEGDDFYISVEFSSGGHAYDRTSEIPVLLGVDSPEFTSVTSTSSPDQSYYFQDGIWKDMYDYDHSANFCIKGLTTVATNLGEDSYELPNGFLLKQNYPNPFNPATNIIFILPEKSFVKLEVFDILGNKITTLVEDELSSGKYSTAFNGEGISAGIYIYRFTTRNFTIAKKMILVK
ncbi:MAG: T9SS type A sorting domain-containing protein [Bacteroidetes bacterium]|nr:T9SS type A sorting domain-containing protein [Bacteroidota bacterium]